MQKQKKQFIGNPVFTGKRTIRSCKVLYYTKYNSIQLFSNASLNINTYHFLPKLSFFSKKMLKLTDGKSSLHVIIKSVNSYQMVEC